MLNCVFAYKNEYEIVPIDKVHFMKKNFWIDAIDPTKDELRKLEEKTGIPFENIKEALDVHERPRATLHEGYQHIVYKAPLTEDKKIETISFSIFVFPNVIITLRKKDFSVFKDIAEMSHASKLQLFKSPANFALHLLDMISDKYFYLLDHIEDNIHQLEERIFKPTRSDIVRDIFKAKRTLIYFHKAMTANRDVTTSISSDFFQRHDFDEHLLRMLRHDITELIDLIGIYREVLSSSMEIYISQTSLSLNVIIKKMTAIASFILIPTLIASIYGMNFRVMPELYWSYGYYFAIGLMVCSVVAMYVYFKRQMWL